MKTMYQIYSIKGGLLPLCFETLEEAQTAVSSKAGADGELRIIRIAANRTLNELGRDLLDSALIALDKEDGEGLSRTAFAWTAEADMKITLGGDMTKSGRAEDVIFLPIHFDAKLTYEEM